MSRIDGFANALLEAHRTGARADGSGLRALSYAEALLIQSRVQEGLGKVGGFKVARRKEGPPVIAPITADCIWASGATVPVRDTMGIELEIGFDVIAEPSGEFMEHPQDFFVPRIVLELVDTRLTGVDEDPIAKLADMQINAGLVTGPVLAGWDGSDFGTVTARLRCGETVVIDGGVQVPGGSALANLALFCAHVADHCGGLHVGQTVITGSISGLHYFQSGIDVEGHIAGFGDVSCRLT